MTLDLDALGDSLSDALSSTPTLSGRDLTDIIDLSVRATPVAGGKGSSPGGAYAAGHPFFGNQWSAAAGGGTSGAAGSAPMSANAAALAAAFPGVSPATLAALAQTNQWFQATKGGSKGSSGSKGGSKGKAKGGAGKSAAATAAAASAAATKAAAFAAASAAATNSPATPASDIKAQAVNALPPSQRALIQKSQVPPSGYKWANGSLVPTTNTGAQNIAAGQALATAKSGAAFAAQSANATAQPSTKTSIAQAAAINAMPPSAISWFQTNRVPPAGYHWSGGVLVQRSNEDIDTRSIGEFASTGPGTGFQPTPDASGAGYLLPVSGKPKPPVPQEATGVGHKFAGMNLMACATCGQPLTANVHRSQKSARSEDGLMTRADSGLIVRSKAQFDADVAQVEPGLEQSMKGLFAKQRSATVSRLSGKRGKRMLRLATLALRDDPPVDGTIPPQDGTTGGVDPATVFDTGFWTQQTAEALTPHLNAVGAIAATRVHNQLGNPSVDTTSSIQSVGDVLAKRARDSAVQITGTTRDAIFQALQEGVAAGEGIVPLTDRINAIFDHADQVRAGTIARTEAIGATNQAAQAYASALPKDVVGSKTWLSHHDDRVRTTHRLADGQVQPVDAPFQVGASLMMFPGDPIAPPGEVINCVVEGTGVSWAGGLRAVYRRRYEGDVVKIRTAYGHSLTVTPNHPVLTDGGWVPAQTLQKGDKLASAARPIGGVQPDVDNVPTSVEQVYRAASESWAIRRVGASSVDFHGDRPDSDVDVVRADGQLGEDAEASPDDVLHHRFFVGSSNGLPGLPGHSDVVVPNGMSGDGRGRGDAPSDVGGTGEFPTFRGSDPLHPQPVGFAPRTDGEVGSPEQPSDDGPVASEVASHREDAVPVLVVLSEVVHVDVVPWSGHVYNLQTEQGWYISDNIISHNCRCGVGYLPPGKTVQDVASPDRLKGLVPQSTLDALSKIQAAQQGKNLVGAGV